MDIDFVFEENDCVGEEIAKICGPENHASISRKHPFSQREIDGVQRVFHVTELSTLLLTSSWRAHAVTDLHKRLDHRDFPCPFAKKSQERSSQWFVFVETDDQEGLEHLRLALMEYVSIIHKTDRISDLLNPLIVMFRPCAEKGSLAEQHTLAWHILQYLHDHDTTPWPATIPTNPDHYLWTFCFGGMQLFINFSASSHREHLSRNLGDGLVLAINPRENFDVVAGNNECGHKVRALVRQRIAHYNGRPASPHLGSYGDPVNREWKQYVAEESSSHHPAKCPLQIRSVRSAVRISGQQLADIEVKASKQPGSFEE